jgi:hypothetical protein
MYNFNHELNQAISNKTLFAFYYISSNEEKDCIFIYPNCILNNTLFGLDKNKQNIVSYSISNLQPFTDFTNDAWNKYSECKGCRYGSPNQQNHIGINGCLGHIEY